MKAGRFVVDTHVHAQRFAAGKGISERPPDASSSKLTAAWARACMTTVWTPTSAFAKLNACALSVRRISRSSFGSVQVTTPVVASAAQLSPANFADSVWSRSQ